MTETPMQAAINSKTLEEILASMNEIDRWSLLRALGSQMKEASSNGSYKAITMEDADIKDELERISEKFKEYMTDLGLNAPRLLELYDKYAVIFNTEGEKLWIRLQKMGYTSNSFQRMPCLNELLGVQYQNADIKERLVPTPSYL